MPGLNIQLDPDTLNEILAPIIDQTVKATVAELKDCWEKFDGQLAYDEETAARLLGLDAWVLRDARLRGEVKASAIVGSRIRYLRQDLVDYLLARRWFKGCNKRGRPRSKEQNTLKQKTA